ncbi:hypothetical protein NQ315_011934 [Exocentrus adspersus]|uniref:SAM-dependent MTase RsmB/NOP-type domain-containing protein n=1 Tax=Exocentrus adspersus TaxID=1586481 RepID=A0AAV8W0Z0_9CUCU|nr:hypothetical protein NQ315_011934 [Exocentrus adspersus]
MFKHSVKVPRLYKVAAKIAKEVEGGAGSIKQLVYENQKKHPNIKALYALVATLFQRSDVVENLLKRSQLLVKEPRSDPWLTKILIVELLWGKKCLPGSSKPEQTVLAYEQIFKAHISDIPITSNDERPDKQGDFKPRYVRVNTLYMTLNEAVDGFRDEGWTLNKVTDKKDYKGFLDGITSLGDEEFSLDIHIPSLLIFPPKTQFYNHAAYKNGSIVLQDKASCLPVHILNPAPGSVVLDMCAAPGMKTTHVAAAINNEGKVYAVEQDLKRFETLKRIVEKSGATCVTTINKDVLTCSEQDFPGVQYILVDPSCSGSGITDRLGVEQSKDNQRLQKLAGFQIKILRSALTKYPDAKRVVYSTCSLFPEENEDVVRQVLETNSSFKLVPGAKFVNDAWKNFGSAEYGDIGKYCLYAKPDEDLTNGFFVAVFERLEEGEENPFFNTKIYNFKKHVQSQEHRKRKQQQQFEEDYKNLRGDGIDNDIAKKGETRENVGNNSCNESGAGVRKKKRSKEKKDHSGKEGGSSCVEVGNTGNESVKEEVAKKKKKQKRELEDSSSEKKVDIIEEGTNLGRDPQDKKRKKKKTLHVENHNETTSCETNAGIKNKKEKKKRD